MKGQAPRASSLPGDSDSVTPPAADEVGRRRRSSLFATTFASLRYRDFVYLWLGQVTHTSGLWIDMVARPLLVLHVSGSAVHLGLVIAARSVSAVGLGLVAGVVADNFDRRVVLLTTKVLVFCLSAVFAAVILLDLIQLWHIYVFTFIRGATQAFDQPARRAMIPSIVPRHLVTNALALSWGSMQVTRILGAGGAGVLIALGGLDAAFVAVVVIYAASVYLTWQLRTPDYERRGYTGVRALGSDLLEGLRFAWKSEAIRGIVIVAAGYFTFAVVFIYVFGPLIATQVLQISDSGFGYMMGAMGVGGVIGTLALAAINPTRGRGYLAIGALMSVGVLMMAVSASTYLESIALTFLIVGVLGVGQSWLHPLVNATLLQEAPEDMRGRMLGLLSLDRAMATVGGAVARFAAAAIGPQLAQIVFGAACVIVSGAMLFAYPPLRRID